MEEAVDELPKEFKLNWTTGQSDGHPVGQNGTTKSERQTVQNHDQDSNFYGMETVTVAIRTREKDACGQNENKDTFLGIHILDLPLPNKLLIYHIMCLINFFN